MLSGKQLLHKSLFIEYGANEDSMIRKVLPEDLYIHFLLRANGKSIHESARETCISRSWARKLCTRVSQKLCPQLVHSYGVSTMHIAHMALASGDLRNHYDMVSPMHQKKSLAIHREIVALTHLRGLMSFDALKRRAQGHESLSIAKALGLRPHLFNDRIHKGKQAIFGEGYGPHAKFLVNLTLLMLSQEEIVPLYTPDSLAAYLKNL